MQLRDYLTKNGLTQHAFGLLMEPPVSQGKVNHWLQGTRRVSLAEALHIQRVTGGEVTVEELAKGLGSKERIKSQASMPIVGARIGKAHGAINSEAHQMVREVA